MTLPRQQLSLQTVRAATLELLADRAPGATICPSEVARAITKRGRINEGWRAAMPLVHAAADELAASGAVQLSWKGQPLTAREGPYRIAFRGKRGGGEA